jgi:hypothetical protein
MKTLSPGPPVRAHFVEMAGVEPASEEKTIKITPYVVDLSTLASGYPTDRMAPRQPPLDPLSRASPEHREGKCPAILPESAFLRSPAKETPGNGLPNYLSSQCVVVVCT